MNKKSLVFIIILSFSLNVLATQTVQFECSELPNLSDFNQSPSSFMDRKIVKYDSFCNRLKDSELVSFDIKQKMRSSIIQRAQSNKRSAISKYGEYPQVLIKNSSSEGVLKNIYSLDAFKVGSSRLDMWSADYWALYKGGPAHRYLDANLNQLIRKTSNNAVWKVAKDYIESNPVENLVQSNVLINASPSEKYDFLIGDNQYTLTKALWKYGEGNYYYYRDKNESWTWMGFCDGWALASTNAVRPKNYIEAIAYDGVTRVRFYPDDIKALATLAYARGYIGGLAIVGTNCKVRSPQKDSNGRILEIHGQEGCFDINPGSWHTVITNQIGKQAQTFIMDATYDLEVWNHPVKSYSYKYFNPKTMVYSDSLEASMVSRSDFYNDKFASYRSNQTKSIVGVVMEVIYLTETGSVGRVNDSPIYDAHRSVKYLYDLEIDASGNIIGGEWYQNAHPDFLWGANTTVTMNTANYNLIKNRWDGTKPIPSDYKEFAQNFYWDGSYYKGTSNYLTPHADIINVLLQYSSK